MGSAPIDTPPSGASSASSSSVAPTPYQSYNELWNQFLNLQGTEKSSSLHQMTEAVWDSMTPVEQETFINNMQTVVTALAEAPTLAPPGDTGPLDGPNAASNPWLQPSVVTALFSIMLQLAQVMAEIQLTEGLGKAKSMLQAMETSVSVAQAQLAAGMQQAFSQITSAIQEMVSGGISIAGAAHSAKAQRSAEKSVENELATAKQNPKFGKPGDVDYPQAGIDRYATARQNYKTAQQEADSATGLSKAFAQQKANKAKSEMERCAPGKEDLDAMVETGPFPAGSTTKPGDIKKPAPPLVADKDWDSDMKQLAKEKGDIVTSLSDPVTMERKKNTLAQQNAQVSQQITSAMGSLSKAVGDAVSANFTMEKAKFDALVTMLQELMQMMQQVLSSHGEAKSASMKEIEDLCQTLKGLSQMITRTFSYQH